jgi:aryl-alcohol dehydrogenase-like predicted oxidoreductase
MTDSAISKYGLGTWTWGHETDLDSADAQLSLFLEVGGTLVDTAANYSDGRSEELLGKLIHRNSCRDNIFLCTKAGVTPTGLDMRPKALMAQLDESLKRLETNHVDLWQLHAWSDQVDLRMSFEALRGALESGKVHHVGVCNYTAEQLARAHDVAAEMGFAIASVQAQYSLLSRAARELAPHLQDGKTRLISWSPLAGGILTGKYQRKVPPNSRATDKRYRDYLDSYLDHPSAVAAVEVLRLVSKAIGKTPAQTALAWVRQQPGVTSVLLGARNDKQLADALESSSLTLPNDILTLLSETTEPPPE